MSKTASQKLLRDLNQRIGQLENEKSLMAKYMGRLEAERDELRERIAKLETALTDICEWTDRYTTAGHPVSTVARRELWVYEKLCGDRLRHIAELELAEVEKVRLRNVITVAIDEIECGSGDELSILRTALLEEDK